MIIIDSEHDTEIIPEKFFLGECLGIILTKRGMDDYHVCFQVVVEDDDSWFITSGSFSTFWLYDLKEQFDLAIEYCEKNCLEDPDGYGYIFNRTNP